MPTTNQSLAVLRESDMKLQLESLGPKTNAEEGEPELFRHEFFNDGEIRFGLWESTPGAWDVVQPRDVVESMTLLTGRIRVTTRGEEPVELVAGDSFVMPKGWSGRWETIETVRKIYTITI